MTVRRINSGEPVSSSTSPGVRAGISLALLVGHRQDASSCPAWRLPHRPQDRGNPLHFSPHDIPRGIRRCFLPLSNRRRACRTAPAGGRAAGGAAVPLGGRAALGGGGPQALPPGAGGREAPEPPPPPGSAAGRGGRRGGGCRDRGPERRRRPHRCAARPGGRGRQRQPPTPRSRHLTAPAATQEVSQAPRGERCCEPPAPRRDE